MDVKLTGEKLNEERAFIKRYTDGLESHKVEYPEDFSTPLSDRPRKVIPVQIAVADPPESVNVDSAAHDATINLTVKSLKPSLTLPITISLTDSVSQLKSLISQASTSAPPADSQRLLLKGKALTDSKLLKEYDITDGAIVHLYFKAAAASAAPPTPALNLESTSASASTSTPPPVDKSTSAPPSPAPPALTITTSVEDGPGTSMPLTNFDLAAPPTGPQPEITSATFHASIADPVFWQKIHALCVTEFEHGDEADLAWEHFLRAMKGKLSAGEAAKIRDVVGVRGMGGGA